MRGHSLSRFRQMNFWKHLDSQVASNVMGNGLTVIHEWAYLAGNTNEKDGVPFSEIHKISA